MEFIDKLSAGLTNAGRTVSQSAKNFSDTNRLKSEISAEKRNIQQKYAEIGQLYYEKFNNDPGCDFFPEVDAIMTSMRHIEALEAEILEVQNRRPELVTVEPRIGDPNIRPSAMVCMQCGQTYDASQTFCSNCGQKLTAQYPTAAAATLAPDQTAADVVNSSVSSVTPAEPNDTRVIPNSPHINLAKTDEPAQEPPKRICLSCGAAAENDSVFCAQCGTKLV
ncbi:MAG: zinc ribbon domain-containing protein [Oscillospiraceae bacterium]|nr:zinc ribbon domain-containing protein [Oscillospiraceae bacterium]